MKKLRELPPPAPEPKTDPAPIDPDQLREQMAQLVRTEAAKIVQGAIEKAKNGHYCLTKLLFSLAGLYPAPVKQDGTPDNSLAEIFFRELGIPLPEPEAKMLPSEAPVVVIQALPAAEPEHRLK